MPLKSESHKPIDLSAALLELARSLAAAEDLMGELALEKYAEATRLWIEMKNDELSVPLEI
jgi:hypothetical protein